MTGGGGGGAVIALCPQKEEAVTSAFKTAGYETLTLFIDPNTQNNKLPKSEHSITLTKKTDERLIVVNENDDVLDFLPRSQCHAGEGILRRAFSIHIFNDRNQIIDIRNFESELIDHPGRFTPWFKMQWEQLRGQLDFNATDLGSS
jgi:hypothetical protein